MDGKRLQERTRLNRPVAYLEIDPEGQVGRVRVGCALNISMSGLMIESDEPVDATQLKIITLAHDGRSIRADAQLIYAIPYFSKNYRSGFMFTGQDDQVATFVSEMTNHP